MRWGFSRDGTHRRGGRWCVGRKLKPRRGRRRGLRKFRVGAHGGREIELGWGGGRSPALLGERAGAPGLVGLEVGVVCGGKVVCVPPAAAVPRTCHPALQSVT